MHTYTNQILLSHPLELFRNTTKHIFLQRVAKPPIEFPFRINSIQKFPPRIKSLQSSFPCGYESPALCARHDEIMASLAPVVRSEIQDADVLQQWAIAQQQERSLQHCALGGTVDFVDLEAAQLRQISKLSGELLDLLLAWALFSGHSQDEITRTEVNLVV